MIGRWLSVDPLEFIDGTNRYKATFIPSNIDPSGTSPTAGTCDITIECVKLVGIGTIGVAEHCGLKTTDASGTVVRYHVAGGVLGAKCKTSNGQTALGISGTYYNRGTVNVPDAVRDCLKANAQRMNDQDLPYQAVPQNSRCGFSPVCNSNYTTKCLMSHCGLGSQFSNQWFPPVGWNHRMKRCTIPVPFRCNCICLKWRIVDSEWCSERKMFDVLNSPTG